MLRGSEAASLRARLADWRAARRPGTDGGHGGDWGGRLQRMSARVRWNPGRSGLLSVLAVALLAMLVAGWWLVRGEPRSLAAVAVVSGHSLAPSQAISPGGSLASPVSRASAPEGSAVSSGAVGQIVVDVVGKVARPGVYRLPAGARVDDAVRAAGGAVPGEDTSSINLARKLTDGEQIVVGVSGAVGGGAPAGGVGAGPVVNGSGPGQQGGLLDLNAATADQLDGLPGVGPVLAQRIVDWRTQHGRFDSVDQLHLVSGVGDAKFAELRPLVVVS